MPNLKLIVDCRIFENQHLLDATEIFRRLNVHKKVCLPNFSRDVWYSNPLTDPSGVVFQVGVPLGDVLFLSILDDSGPHKGRSKLTARYGKQNNVIWRRYLGELHFLRDETARRPQGNIEDSVDKVDKILHWPICMCDEGCMEHEQRAGALVMWGHARNEADWAHRIWCTFSI